MDKSHKAVIWGGAWAVFVACLALLHVADFGFGIGVAAVAVNSFANTVAAWVAFVTLLAATRGERGESRKPWVQIAAAYGILAAVQTVLFYFVNIDPTAPGLLWVCNLIIFGAYIFLGVGIASKAGRLRGGRGTARAAVLAFFGLTFVLVVIGIFITSVVPQPVRMPLIAKAFMLLYLSLDIAVLIFAVSVALTYAGGTGGRPWVALAVGLFFAGLSNVADIYGGFHGFPDAISSSSIALVLTFASFGAVSWAAVRQREILRVRV